MHRQPRASKGNPPLPKVTSFRATRSPSKPAQGQPKASIQATFTTTFRGLWGGSKDPDNSDTLSTSSESSTSSISPRAPQNSLEKNLLEDPAFQNTLQQTQRDLENQTYESNIAESTREYADNVTDSAAVMNNATITTEESPRETTPVAISRTALSKVASGIASLSQTNKGQLLEKAFRLEEDQITNATQLDQNINGIFNSHTEEVTDYFNKEMATIKLEMRGLEPHVDDLHIQFSNNRALSHYERASSESDPSNNTPFTLEVFEAMLDLKDEISDLKEDLETAQAPLVEREHKEQDITRMHHYLTKQNMTKEDIIELGQTIETMIKHETQDDPRLSYIEQLNTLDSPDDQTIETTLRSIAEIAQEHEIDLRELKTEMVLPQKISANLALLQNQDHTLTNKELTSISSTLALKLDPGPEAPMDMLDKDFLNSFKNLGEEDKDFLKPELLTKMATLAAKYDIPLNSIIDDLFFTA